MRSNLLTHVQYSFQPIALLIVLGTPVYRALSAFFLPSVSIIIRNTDQHSHSC
jgi:hypothetical protein